MINPPLFPNYSNFYVSESYTTIPVVLSVSTCYFQVPLSSDNNYYDYPHTTALSITLDPSICSTYLGGFEPLGFYSQT